MLKYTQEWEKTVTRQARWVDFENDYKTMDLDYMESVMWAFKQLWEKGLIYQSNRVLPYSWGAETPLSNHEIRLDDATRPRQDPAITVAFTARRPLRPSGRHRLAPARILAWTTTPWTLPSNLALAVGPDLDYAVMADADGSRYLLGEAVLEKYAQAARAGHPGGHGEGPTSSWAVPTTPLFPYFADMAEVDPDQAPPRHRAGPSSDARPATSSTPPRAPAWSTWPRGSARTISGSCDEVGIGMVVPVDDSGRFTDDVPEWAGENVLEANSRHHQATCATPADWCATTATPTTTPTAGAPTRRSSTGPCPRGTSKVTAIRDRLLETNQEINWVPDHIRDGRFGHVAGGRPRLVDQPQPVLGLPDPGVGERRPRAHPRTDVYGSLDELEA